LYQDVSRAERAPTSFEREKLNRTIILGIVGGIGSGKSFVSDAFVANGAARFDADKEAKLLYERADFLDVLRARWSNAFDSQGVLNRSALARIVFEPTEQGRAELEFLNDAFAPFLRVRYETWLQELREQSVPLAILDAPLLFERGWNAQVDYVVFVDASLPTRLRRVAARGWNDDELKRREACQLPLDYKRERSDFIVYTDRDDSQVPEQLMKIIDQIRLKNDALV